MKHPKRTAPMWIVRDGEIVRMLDMPGLPSAPCVEGKIIRTPAKDESDA